MLVSSVGVAERLIALGLKPRGCNRSEGSNPSAYVYRTTVLFYYSSLFFVFFVFMIISPSWASVQRLGM